MKNTITSARPLTRAGLMALVVFVPAMALLAELHPRPRLRHVQVPRNVIAFRLVAPA